MAKLTDNSPQVLAAIDAAIESGLTIIGGKAEGYAKALTPVDTGLLRNSITYALGGQPPAISSYHAAYGSNRVASGKNAGKRYSATSTKAGAVGFGQYQGAAPADEANQRSVYIGTNVEYGPYIEYGTSRMKAQPFITPAMEPHLDEYKAVMASELQKAVGNLK